MQSDRDFWENDYYRNLKTSEKDFLDHSFLEKYEDKIINTRPKLALDLGCGLGQDARWLVDHGFEVIATDFAESAIKYTQETCSKAQVRLLDMLEGLPFDDNGFGLINANLSLHYFAMDETVYLFKEIYRVLTPGGRLIGVVNSARNGYAKDEYIASQEDKNYYYNSKRKQHKRLFDQEQFDYLAHKLPWKIEVLTENGITRKGRKKYTWEFVWEK